MLDKKSASTEILSSAMRRNGFHQKYIAVCKSKNLQPLPEVKAKQSNSHVLDFHADRVRVYDWIAICSSLYNDKTLKSLAIRLRKNTGFVLDEADTLKKAKSVVSLPVIYSKFLLTELVEAVQNLLMNSKQLESLTIEGFPLGGQFMSTLVKGLANNSSVTTLSFARSNIGDAACEEVCATLKHLANISTLNFCGCNVGIKGAEAVANLIKFHKIQRFSDAWERSLRYRDVDPEAFSGLRKISLSNNPQIGNDGLEMLTDVLREDVWVKDVEMQSCGLGDDGAQHIVQCLNVNKTILGFDITNNPDVSDQLFRHILMTLGSAENESSDGSDAKPEKVTKAKLKEQVKFLEDRLELEIGRRMAMEKLNETLHIQSGEFQQQLNIRGAFQVPNGFTLVANETLDKLLEEKSNQPSGRHRHTLPAKKALSYIISNPTSDIHDMSKSEVLIHPVDEQKKTFVEQNIGDSVRQGTAELLQTSQPPLALKFDPRSLFTNSPKRVPPNSAASVVTLMPAVAFFKSTSPDSNVSDKTLIPLDVSSKFSPPNSASSDVTSMAAVNTFNDSNMPGKILIPSKLSPPNSASSVGTLMPTVSNREHHKILIPSKLSPPNSASSDATLMPNGIDSNQHSFDPRSIFMKPIPPRSDETSI